MLLIPYLKIARFNLKIARFTLHNKSFLNNLLRYGKDENKKGKVSLL